MGRSDENVLVIPRPEVSRRHAVIRHVEGRWFVVDEGSFNGTLVNGVRLPPKVAIVLRDGDEVGIGAETLVFSDAKADDPDRTAEMEPIPGGNDRKGQLSAFQIRIVSLLCEGVAFDKTPSNEEIAARLGSSDAEAVKAAFRRIYAKLGLTDMPAQQKRRRLCRIARERGWG